MKNHEKALIGDWLEAHLDIRKKMVKAVESAVTENEIDALDIVFEIWKEEFGAKKVRTKKSK